jgi:hypothetical protein
MRSIRIFLALLIALALPAQTLADARMATGCCPMSAMDMQAAMASGHDCCDEHDTHSSGAHCDAGSMCHCGFHLALAFHDFPPPGVRERAHYSSAISTQPYPTPSSAHWRPPALRSVLI